MKDSHNVQTLQRGLSSGQVFQFLVDTFDLVELQRLFQVVFQTLDHLLCEYGEAGRGSRGAPSRAHIRDISSSTSESVLTAAQTAFYRFSLLGTSSLDFRNNSNFSSATSLVSLASLV